MSSAMLCRVCLKEEDGYVSLLNLYYENIPVSLFIKDIFNLKMEHDSSSLVICNMCNHVMKNFYDFYKMVKEAHNNYERLHYRGREFDISLNMECTENEGDPYNDNFEINPYMSKPDSGVKKRQEDKIIIPKSVIKREYEASLISDKNFMRPIVALEETNVDTVDPPSVAMPDPVDDPLSDHQEQEVPKSKPKKSRMNTAKAKAATKKLLLEYKPEEMYHEGHWLFTEDQMNYVFSLYVELKCTKCALPVFSNLKDLESHSQSEHDCSPVLYCCQYGTANRDRLKRHILFRHVLNCAPPRVFPTAICTLKKYPDLIKCRHNTKKFRCITLNDKDVEAFRSTYNCQENKMEKDRFLIKYCSGVSVSGHRKGDETRRNLHIKYFVRKFDEDLSIPVCQKAFMEILNIKKDRILGAVRRKMKFGGVVKDRRGGDQKSLKFKPKRESVNYFIESLKGIEHLYCRNKTCDGKCSLSDLNRKQLWKRYNSLTTNPDLQVTEKFFRDIFNAKTKRKEGNVKVAAPKKPGVERKKRVRKEKVPKTATKAPIVQNAPSVSNYPMDQTNQSYAKDMSKKIVQPMVQDMPVVSNCQPVHPYSTYPRDPPGFSVLFSHSSTSRAPPMGNWRPPFGTHHHPGPV